MSSHHDNLLQQYDETQVTMMEEEVLVVDENDVVTGRGSKKDSMLFPPVLHEKAKLTISPLDDQHRCWPFTSCVQCILVQHCWSIVDPKTC